MTRFADIHAARREQVAAADLERLSYRQRRVLELYYGLGGEHARTLDEVGRTFNVTRERIRQIVKQAERELGITGPYLRSAADSDPRRGGTLSRSSPRLGG